MRVLFVKVLRRDMKGWRQVLGNVVEEVVEVGRLELYEGVVFAPFKD